MKSKIKLTTTAVDKLRSPEGAVSKTGTPLSHFVFWDTELKGLGVRVSASSSTKTYLMQRRVKGGPQRNISIGRHGDPVLLPDGKLRSYPFGADDARTLALATLAQLRSGVDPVAEEQRKRKEAERQAEQDKALGTTLRQVMTYYFEHHRVKGRPLRPKTKLDYRLFMERHFADWLDAPVANIDRLMCEDKITEIEKSSPIQAHKASVYLRLMLNAAREQHADPKTGEYTILAVNPAERARKIKKTHPPKARDRSIDLAKIGAVWSLLRQRAANPVRDLDRTAADWVSTLILTGWRATECAALEWSWVNFDAKTITLPGDVDTTDERLFAGVKTHAEMTWPMSDVLHDILKARSELDGKDERYVFPSRADNDVPYIAHARGTLKAIAEVADCYLVKDGKKIYRLSPHDLRRTTVRVAIACRVDYSLRMRMLNHAASSVHDDYERDRNPETLRPGVNAVATYILDAAAVAEAQASGANVVNLADRREA
jgi:integrase